MCINGAQCVSEERVRVVRAHASQRVCHQARDGPNICAITSQHMAAIKLYSHCYVCTCTARIETFCNNPNMAFTRVYVAINTKHTHTHEQHNYIFDTTSFPHLTVCMSSSSGWSPFCYIISRTKINMLCDAAAAAATACVRPNSCHACW